MVAVMSLIDLLSERQRLSLFLDKLECLLLSCSEQGIINEANPLAIKTLQFNPKSYMGTCLYEHCRKKHFSLIKLLDDSSDSEAYCLKETYLVKNKPTTILWKKIILPLENQTEKGFLFVGNNVSKEQASTEKLKETVHFYENILSKLPTNVYWKDTHSVYLGCNDRLANIMKLPSRHAIKGMTDYDFDWGQDAAESFIAFDKKVMQTGRSLTTEDVFKEASGKVVTVLTNKTPLANKEGKTIGVLAISVDITERKKMERDLQQSKEAAEAADKAKTEFLQNMRHDIRTPLTGIVGIANIISDETTDPKIKEYVNNLVASSDALQNLLNEILEVIRIGSQIPIRKNKFDLHQKLMDVISLNKAKALHKHLQLEFVYDEKLPPYVIGDPIRIHRIALELLTNAISFTAKGSVKLTVELAKKIKNKLVVKMTVEDTGIGIPHDKQDEIFLQFKRLTPSYQGIYKGAGLGLTIAKTFIEELSGEIYVESQESKGSKFICVIPLQKPLLDESLGEDVGASTSKPLFEESLSFREQTTQSKQKSYILLIEDEPLAAKIVEKMLLNLSCDISIAKDGRTAIELFQRNHYDLIFVDIGLPDIDGYEVTKRIRLLELNKEMHVPIIALTAHVDEENKQHCINVGMNAVLSKPLDKNKARDILNAFTSYRGQPIESPVLTESSIPLEDKVIDLDVVRKLYGAKEEIVWDLIKMLIDGFPEDLEKFQLAYKQADWPSMQAMAHKLSGGASYCGAARLKKACSQLESAIKENRAELYAKLYQQLLVEIEAIKKSIKTNS